MTNNLIINKATLLVLLLATIIPAQAEEITIEQLIPVGFSAVEENNTLQLLGILEGKTLPSPFFSRKKNSS